MGIAVVLVVLLKIKFDSILLLCTSDLSTVIHILCNLLIYYKHIFLLFR